MDKTPNSYFKTIPIAKIIIFILVVGAFITLTFVISKGFSTTCLTGSEYNKTLKRCVPICTDGQKYYNQTNSCLDCPPGQEKIGDGCADICPKGFKKCGSNCYDETHYTCEINGLCRTDFLAKNTWSISSNNSTIHLPDAKAFGENTDTKYFKIQTTDKLYYVWYRFGEITKDPGVQNATGLQVDISIDYTAVQVAKATYSIISQNSIGVYIETFKKPDYEQPDYEQQYSNVLTITGGTITPGVMPNTTTTSCCPKGSHWNDNNNICQGCGNCCTPDQTFMDNICCDNKDIHGGKCCKIYSTEDGCCNDNAKVTTDGKYCLNVCKDKDVSCHNSDACVNDIKTYNPAGDVVNVTSYCVNENNVCNFTEEDMDPPAIILKDKPQLHVCKHEDDIVNLGPFATCNLEGGLLSRYTKKITSTYDNENCTIENCITSKQNYGLISVDFDKSKKTCNSTISCPLAENTKEICGDCPFGNGNAQCCYDKDNKYNGLSCGNNLYCKDNVCVTGWLPNGKNGPNFSCVERRAEKGEDNQATSTQAECLINNCKGGSGIGQNQDCCAPGWTFNNGKCFQDHYAGLCKGASGILSGGNDTQCNGGTCGPSYKSDCNTNHWDLFKTKSTCYASCQTGGLPGGDPTKGYDTTHCSCDTNGSWYKFDNGKSAAFDVSKNAQPGFCTVNVNDAGCI